MMLKEIYTWKHLIFELVSRNLKLRYSVTSFGFFWAFLSPLLLATIYCFVFSYLLRINVEDTPFFLYLLSGIFPWQFFQMSIAQGACSLMENKHLIRESNFPHFIVPLAIVLSNGVIFLPSLLLLVIFAGITLKGVPLIIIFIPLYILFLLIMAFSLSVIASIFYLRWRDLPHFLEISLTFLFYWTPIVYPLSLVSDSIPSVIQKIYMFNPFIGMISLFRMILIKGFSGIIESQVPFFILYVLPVLFCGFIFFAAHFYYQRNKEWINDYLSY